MYFKKRTKGVITVFLLITFSVSFVFAGLLVDGGRVKLAKTLGEASLDNAAVSALSYYDDLLVDLYGMFAMNEADADAIKKRWSSTLRKHWLWCRGTIQNYRIF